MNDDAKTARVALVLPATVEVGPVHKVVLPCAYQLAHDAKIVDPPAGAEEPSVMWAREHLSQFTMPIGHGDNFPKVHYRCTAVNGALLRVTTRTTTQRTRRKSTGDIIAESTSHDVVSASWLPVPVTRECDIARPMDYIYSPYASNTRVDGPHLQGSVSRKEGDLYAPRCFVSPRIAPSFDFHYDVHARKQNVDATGKVSKTYVASTIVRITDTLPPPPTKAHTEYIAENSGQPCVKVIERLLHERPIWRARALADALWNSGQCPQRHVNIVMIKCFTYAIAKGPFQGLRVSYKCNPLSSESFAVLQCIVLRIARTSVLGVAIRDTARIRNVKRVLERCPPLPTLGSSSAPFRVNGTMEAFVHQFVAGGHLWGKVQIIDVMDHPAFALEAARNISFSPHHGYYTEESLATMSRIVEDQLRQTVLTDVPAVLRATPPEDNDGPGDASSGSDVPDEEDAEGDTDDNASDEEGGGRKRPRSDEEFSE